MKYYMDNCSQQDFREYVLGIDRRLHDRKGTVLDETAVGRVNKSLSLIYNYDELNDFGRIIFDCTRTYIFGWHVMPAAKGESDEEKKNRNMQQRRNFVQAGKSEENREEASIFLFWGLMILEVGDEGRTAPFAKIRALASDLGFSETELIDIADVVRVVTYDGGQIKHREELIEQLLLGRKRLAE